MAVRILLVDDHPIVRQGLRTLLEGRTGWEVVGEASDGVEALDKVEALQPDVVAKDVKQRRGWIDIQGVRAAVDLKCDAAHVCSCPGRMGLRMFHFSE